MKVSEVVYNGRDNAIELSLSVDGLDIDHSTITRCQVTVGSMTIDSDTSPSMFVFTYTDRLIMMLGSAGIAEGEYVAKIYIYDANNSNGLYWGEFYLTVSS